MKKSFKKLLVALLGVTMIASFTACSDDDDDNNNSNNSSVNTEEQVYSKLVGTWEWRKPYYVYEVLTLKSDKTGTLYDEYDDDPEPLIQKFDITYKYDDKSKMFSYTLTEDGEKITNEYKFVSVDGSKLVLQYGDKASDTVVYKKKF